MLVSSYRVNNPITVEVREQGHYRLRELPIGSMLLCANLQPDPNHMICGTCNGISVYVFARDLENQAERIDSNASMEGGAMRSSLEETKVSA
jgi:hypothetical protein